MNTGQDQQTLPKLEKLDEETVQKIDYIIRGLELGKFDETSKKVEFLGKLSGDPKPGYIEKLLSRISQLENENAQLEVESGQHMNRIIQLETTKTDIEGRINTLENDINVVAKAIRQIFEPKPLKDNWDMQEIHNFCNNHGASSY